jgi:hypothetical protein
MASNKVTYLDSGVLINAFNAIYDACVLYPAPNTARLRNCPNPF